MSDIDEILAGIRAQRANWAAQKTAGERFTVPRDGFDGVETIIYRPARAERPLPMIFNMHGGAWIGGDAVLMESFCQLLADSVTAFVVNVNYTKADVRPFPYAIREIADSVKYFKRHAADYGCNPDKIAVGGHSAGAQLAAGAAMLLKEEGVELSAQLLVYPCVDMRASDEGFMAMVGPMLFKNGENLHRWASPLFASDADLTGLSPAIFVLCGMDDLKPQGIAYAKRLMGAGVPVCVKEYPKALHGFVEVNRPDYPSDDPRVTPEQAEYCRDAEKYIVNELRARFA